MAIYFKHRWYRFFSDSGLPVKGNEDLLFAQTARVGPVTQTFVGFKRSDPNFQGTKSVAAKNLKLSALFKNIGPVSVYAYTPKTYREIAGMLIEIYGLPLEADWFIDGVITPAQIQNMPFDITLQLNNVPWCENDGVGLKVTVREPTVDIAATFKNTKLTATTLPYTVRAGKTNVELISIGTDFTPLFMDDYAQLLVITSSADLSSPVLPNVERADVLVRLLGDRLKIPCTRLQEHAPGELTTFGATFQYNGPTTGYATADTRYSRVLVFDVLGETYQGRFYFHYNILA